MKSKKEPAAVEEAPEKDESPKTRTLFVNLQNINTIRKKSGSEAYIVDFINGRSAEFVVNPLAMDRMFGREDWVCR